MISLINSLVVLTSKSIEYVDEADSWEAALLDIVHFLKHKATLQMLTLYILRLPCLRSHTDRLPRQLAQQRGGMEGYVA